MSENLINTYLMTWKPNNRLCQYSRHLGFMKTTFSAHELLSFIFNHVFSRQMYDPTNPLIVHPAQELEEIIRARVLHIHQLRSYVLQQITFQRPIERILVQPFSWPDVVTNFHGYNPHPTTNAGRFVMSTALRQTFMTVPTISMPSSIVTFQQTCGLLSEYVLYNRFRLFDWRNVVIAMVHDDPLGSVFEVNSFHRDQAAYFLRKQLFPLATQISYLPNLPPTLPPPNPVCKTQKSILKKILFRKNINKNRYTFYVSEKN